MNNILVVDVMTREPVTARPNESLLECAKKMVRKKVNSLVLVEGKKLVGFISQKDILWALIKKSRAELSEIKAGDISPKKIITIRPNATAKEAIDKMKKTKFERLPVVENNQLVGMITVRDILSFQPEFYPELEEFAKIREEEVKLKRIKEMKNKVSISDGICEECGNRAALYKTHGMAVCESCFSSI